VNLEVISEICCNQASLILELSRSFGSQLRTKSTKAMLRVLENGLWQECEKRADELEKCLETEATPSAWFSSGGKGGNVTQIRKVQTRLRWGPVREPRSLRRIRLDRQGGKID